MIKQNILLLLLLIIYSVNASGGEEQFDYFKNDFCATTAPTCSYDEETKMYDEVQFSPDDVVIDDVNWGKILQIGKHFVLFESARILKSCNDLQLQQQCPQGFKSFTIDEYKEMNDWLIKHKQLDKLIEMGFYRPSEQRPAQKNSWYPSYLGNERLFGCYYSSFRLEVAEDGENKLVYDRFDTRWFNSHWDKDENNQFTWGKCMLDTYFSVIPLSELIDGPVDFDDREITECDYNRLTVKDDVRNVVSYEWEYNGQKSTEKQFDIIAYPSKKWCNTYKFTVNFYGGCKVTFENRFFIQKYVDWQDSTNLLKSKDDLHVKKYNIKCNLENWAHFKPGSSTLGVIPGGGSYLIYSTAQETPGDYRDEGIRLKLLKIDNEGNIIHRHDLGREGRIASITVTPYGFVYLYELNDTKGFFCGCKENEDGTIEEVWHQVLINREENQQMNVGDRFGVRIMTKLSNGRLNYQRGLIFCVFGHDNTFPAGGSHQGDTVIVISSLDGSFVRLINNWQTSHSLKQISYYDGKYIYQGTLSDGSGYGMKTYRYGNSGDRFAESMILIPVNQSGKAGKVTGRIGNFSDIGKKSDNLKAIPFAVRPIQDQPEDTLSLFIAQEKAYDDPSNTDLFKVVELVDSGKYVPNLKSARFGEHVLVGYCKFGEERQQAKSSLDYLVINTVVGLKSDDMYLLLADKEGNVLSHFKADENLISATDDWFTLNDGRVAWSFVSEDGELVYAYTNPTQQDNTQYEILQKQCESKQTFESVTDYQNYLKREKAKKSNLSKKEDGGNTALIVIILCLLFLIIAVIGGFGYWYLKKVRKQTQILNKEIEKEEGEQNKINVKSEPEQPVNKVD